MPTLVMMIGAPGSGKSYAANKISEKLDAGIVSTDKIRGALYGDEACQDDSARVFGYAYRLIAEYLSNGRNVVFDATNASAKYRRTSILSIKNRCDEIGLDFDKNVNLCAVVMDVPLETCLERNLGRDRVVPREAIERMHQKIDPSHIEQEGFDEVFILDENFTEFEPDLSYEKE